MPDTTLQPEIEGMKPVQGIHAPDHQGRGRDSARAMARAGGFLTWTWAAGESMIESAAWQAFTGQDRRAVEAGGWREAVHPEDVERVQTAWAMGDAITVPGEIEFRLRRFDGEYRAMLARVIAPEGDASATRTWLGFAVDISDKVAALDRAESARADEAYARSSQLEAVFEGMVDGVLVCDGNGKILHMNAAYRNMLGLRDSDRDAVSLPEGRGRLFSPRDRHGEVLADEQRPVARILRGESLNGSPDADYMVRTVDGREILLSVSGAPVNDARHRIIGAVAIFQDVTERRAMGHRTQDALNALLAIAEALVRDGLEGDGAGAAAVTDMAERLARLTLTVLGCQRVVLAAHDAEHGLAPIGMASNYTGRIAVPVAWDREEISRFLNASLGGEVIARLASGEVLSIDLAHPPWRNRPNPLAARSILLCPMRIDSTFVGALLIDRGPDDYDVSADERMLAGAVASLIGLLVERSRLRREQARSETRELALRETNRRMNEFLGIAGHELRTPLTSISAGIQLAERRLQHAAADRTLDADVLAGHFAMASTILGRIYDQIRRLDRLIGDLLDVSRIEADRLQLRLAPCDIVNVVRAVVNDHRLLEPKRTIGFEADEGSGSIVLADADRIAQVVTNFITNALKYSSFDAPITVRVAVMAEVARVSVTDRGQGLEPDEQAHIWERFYRAPGVEVQTGSGVGLGLGLHISSTIIESHAGNIGVDSARGKGSTFWFELPLNA